MIHTFTFKIAFADTDAGGIVYHAKYLEIAERARFELFSLLEKQLSFNFENLAWCYVVKNLSIDYIEPIFLSDEVSVQSSIVKLTRYQIVFFQDFFVNGMLKAKMSVCVVSVNKSTKELVKIDENIFNYLNLKKGEKNG